MYEQNKCKLNLLPGVETLLCDVLQVQRHANMDISYARFSIKEDILAAKSKSLSQKCWRKEKRRPEPLYTETERRSLHLI